MKNPLIAVLGVILVLGLVGGALWYLDRAPEDEIDASGRSDSGLVDEELDVDPREARRERTPLGDDGRVTLRDASEIQEAATAWVLGRAVNAVSRKPVAGATVTLTGPGAAVEVTSDDSGQFRVAATSLEIPWKLRVSFETLTSDLLPVEGLTAQEERQLGDIALKPAGRIQGAVAGRGGEPLAEVKLALFRDTTMNAAGGFDFEKVFSTIMNADDPVEVVRSGKDGRFEFPEVPADSYVIRASLEEHETRFSDPVRVREGGAAPFVRVQLPPGVKQKGKVVDAKDKPVVSAMVAFLINNDRGMPSTFRTQKVTTDEKGHFIIDTLSRQPYVIFVHKDGLPPGGTQRITPGQEEELLIKLPEPQKIHGRITDAASGAAITDARVVIFTQKNPGLMRATSDAEGRYEIPGVPTGDQLMIMVTHPTYHLKADKDGGMQERMMGALQANAAKVKEKNGRFDFEMTRGARVKGRVIDRESGLGIPGAYVRVSDPQRMMFNFGGSVAKSQARTDADGRFVLEDLSPGEVIALAWHPDYFSSQKISMWGGQRDSMTTLRALDDLTLPDIPLDKGLKIEGVVVDPKGEPVAGARVKDLIQEENAMLDALFAAQDAPVYSDREGRFSITGIKPTAKGKILATHPDFGTGAEIEFGSATELPREVRLELAAGATVKGVLRRGDGRPAAGATLMITIKGATQIPDSNMFMMFTRGEEGLQRSAISDEEGRFRFEDLPAGEGQITIEDLSLGLLAEGQGKATLRSGETADMNLTLLPTVSSTGVVLGPGGNPVDKVYISISGGPGSTGKWGSMRHTFSDAQGRFTFDGLQAGAEYSINCWHQADGGEAEEALSGNIDFRGGDNGIQLKLRTFEIGRKSAEPLEAEGPK